MVLAQHGVPALRIHRLASRLGLSKGSFYHHFDGIPGYRTALLAHVEQQSRRALHRRRRGVRCRRREGRARPAHGPRADQATTTASRRLSGPGRCRTPRPHETQRRVDAVRVAYLEGLCQELGHGRHALDTARAVYLLLDRRRAGHPPAVRELTSAACGPAPSTALPIPSRPTDADRRSGPVARRPPGGDRRGDQAAAQDLGHLQQPGGAVARATGTDAAARPTTTAPASLPIVISVPVAPRPRCDGRRKPPPFRGPGATRRAPRRGPAEATERRRESITCAHRPPPPAAPCSSRSPPGSSWASSRGCSRGGRARTRRGGSRCGSSERRCSSPAPWCSCRRSCGSCARGGDARTGGAHRAPGGRGLYRYVRNPMYVAVVGAVIGQGLVLGRPVLLVYAGLIGAGMGAFARWYEEPVLAERTATSTPPTAGTSVGGCPACGRGAPARLRPEPPPAVGGCGSTDSATSPGQAVDIPSVGVVSRTGRRGGMLNVGGGVHPLAAITSVTSAMLRTSSP